MVGKAFLKNGTFVSHMATADHIALEGWCTKG